MYRLPVTLLVTAAALFAAAPAQGDWSCGPGPSVEAHAVPGGIEVTFAPAETYHLRVRSAKDLTGHGMSAKSIEASPADVPVFIAETPGKPVMRVLAFAKGRKGEPYPRLGCPTPKIIVE